MGSISPGNIRAIISRSSSSRRLTIVVGSLIISAWTLLRFFNHGPNFDQLGQQTLAHQWLNGLHSGAVIGPTNYVLKMLFLYVPFDFVPLPPQFKLVFMTLLVNIATFVLLVYALERIWSEFYPKPKDSFYLPLIYLSLISGSVFWISFSNSRNLEVAGGVFLIYLYLRALSHPSRRYYAWLILLGTLVFFADPLQIYMTLLPVLVFIGLRWNTKRGRRQFSILLKIVGCAGISILLAHFLAIVVEGLWNISFISTKQSVSFPLSSLKPAIEHMTKLYAGGYEGGRARELLNLLVVAGAAAAAAYYAWRKPKARPLLTLAAIVWVVDLIVFIASGQAQQADTNRYLIMSVPMFILVLAVILYHLPATKSRNYIVAFVLLFNSLSLAVGFAKAWDPRFTNNNHDRSVISYFKDHQYSYGYASIGTAISSDYLSNWKVNLLPLGCDPDYILKKANLFFDKAAFEITQQSDPQTLIPIILDGDNITINHSVCKVEQIQRQLGPSPRIDQLSDGSLVLLYRASQLDALRPISD